MQFLETIARRVIVFDGAMGTVVQSRGFRDEDFGGPTFRMLTDLLTLSHPECLKEIHLDYFRAGADAVETNTFGSSPLRLSEYDFRDLDSTAFAPLPEDADLRQMSYPELARLINRRAAQIACEARDAYRASSEYDGRELFVVGSAGPSNRFLSSSDADLTRSTFPEIFENAHIQASGLIEGGVDVILFETQQDILETKAAVMGAQQAIRTGGREIALMCQVAVDPFSRMPIFNTDIHAACVTLQGVGIHAFGVNCGVGPDLMEKTVEKLARYCPLPISVIPNAGLPTSEAGRTVFKFPPDQMAECLKRYIEESGVSIVGGCCGTTPEHIAALRAAVDGANRSERRPERGIFISGPQQAVPIDSREGLIRIGERLNVRGSKKVREAVESGGEINQEALEEVVHDQVHELGLSIIDVCMDSNVRDTAETLTQVVYRQTTDFSGALCIDSFEFEALIKAIEVYPGRPILNSISMEEVSPGRTKLDAVLQATAAHHPMYIALAAGPKGPGATVATKTMLAKQIVEAAAGHGVTPDQLFIDMNVFPIGSEAEEGTNFALESLEAIPPIKAIHPDLLTVCGVGNLTMGLAKKPYMRTVLTSVWLDEARKRGLDAAIVNPNHYVVAADLEPRDYELGLRTILEHDMDAFAKLEAIADEKSGATSKVRSTYDDLPIEVAICEKIKDGFKRREHGTIEIDGHAYPYADRIVLQVAEVVRSIDPLSFINAHLMKAMNELGGAFARGEVSLPHLLKSADVMKQVMSFLERYVRTSSGSSETPQISYKGTVVLGTVHQDVHSIGKDLAKTLFENYGYRVIDLGVMVPLQSFIDAAREHQADAIGMSALLVQTSNHMIAVSRMMRDQGLAHLPVLIGGAPVSQRHAAYVAMAGGRDPNEIRDNVFYCATAMDGVNVMNRLLGAQDTGEFFTSNRKRMRASLIRAEEKALRTEELLRTLPRRAVSFEAHRFPERTWVAYETFSCPLTQFREHIDTRTLFGLNWKFGAEEPRAKQGETPEKLDALFDEWIAHAGHERWIRPMGIFGVFPCQSDGDELIVYDITDLPKELCRFRFDVLIGAGRKDLISGAQYFAPRDSGRLDAVGLQLSTSGPQVQHQLARFRADGDSEACLYLQGLSDRIAEDVAQYLHDGLRRRLGFTPEHGARWSPGYPAISDTAHNKTIWSVLHASDLIGVQVTEAGEFSPTGTTAAIVCFHPNADELF